MFPIELGHYRCKLMHDTSTLETRFSLMNLKPYRTRNYFDDKSFVAHHFRVNATFLHQPHLEDYWADCAGEFEVRKRLWSRFTLNQIITLKIPMDTRGVENDDEDVLDPQYTELVECVPILEIDWSKREEDDVRLRTHNVIKIIKNWRAEKRREKIVKDVPKVRRDSTPLEIHSPPIFTNVIETLSPTGKFQQKTKVLPEQQEPFVTQSNIRITHSQSKKKPKPTKSPYIVIDLEPVEKENIEQTDPVMDKFLRSLQQLKKVKQ